MEGSEYQVRSFVAVWPPPELLERITDTVRRWMRRIGTTGVKWVSPQNLHLTLEFLGNVRASTLDDLRARLRSACGSFGAFEVEIAGAGCFPDPARPKVLWLGMRGEVERMRVLQRTAGDACKGFGEPRDGKPFSPHVTIARFDWLSREQIGHVRRIASDASESELGAWSVDAVTLMRSDLGSGGSRYTVLEKVLL